MGNEFFEGRIGRAIFWKCAHMRLNGWAVCGLDEPVDAILGGLRR